MYSRRRIRTVNGVASTLSEVTPAVTDQSFMPATGDNLNYSPGASIDAGDQLGRI